MVLPGKSGVPPGHPMVVSIGALPPSPSLKIHAQENLLRT